MTSAPGISAGDSSTIRITRVLCIFFMTYVHVPVINPFDPHLPATLSAVHGFMADLLGRASVPALSVLGGFLAVGAYRKRAQWSRYARERIVTLGVPLVTWNCLFILPGLLSLHLTGRMNPTLQSIFPAGEPSVRLVLDRLVAIDYGSATVALNFLRDLLACSLLLPMLRWLVGRFGAVGLGSLWAAGLTVGFAPVVVRPQILMFFAAGVHLAVRAGQLRPARKTFSALAAAVLLPLAAVAWIPPLAHDYAGNVPGAAGRTAITLAVLVLAARLGRSRVGARLARFEPCAYLLFLSHQFFMMVLYWPWYRVFGAGVEGAYLAFYIGAPVFAALAAGALHHLLATLPAFLQILVGGRRMDRPASASEPSTRPPLPEQVRASLAGRAWQAPMPQRRSAGEPVGTRPGRRRRGAAAATTRRT